MMTLSAGVVLIRNIGCLLIVSLDAHWQISITAYAEKIHEDCSVCGIGLKNNGERGRGGSPPENGISYPWMVSIGWDYSTHNCLGTMIDAYHIITAAHCVKDEEGEIQYYDKVHFRNQPQTGRNDGYTMDKIIVHPQFGLMDSESTGVTIAKYDIALVKLKQRIKCDKYKNPICLPRAGFRFSLGDKNIFTGEEGELQYYDKVHFRNQPQIGRNDGDGYTIEKIIVHPQFGLMDSESTGVTIAKYDIALVKLKQRIKCDKHKNPICLPRAGFRFSLGDRNIFTGWGFPDPATRHRTELLRHSFIKNLNFSECIKGVPETRRIKNHMLCQGGTRHRMCYGDSGGPLMKKINKKYYIVGIASSETNTNCALHKPMIFTDVVKFLDWIQKEKGTTVNFPRGRQQSPEWEGRRQRSPEWEDGRQQSPSWEDGRQQSPSWEGGRQRSPRWEGGRQQSPRWKNGWMTFTSIWHMWNRR